MKFKIKHRTPLFELGIIIPGIAVPVMLLMIVLCFGVTFPDCPWLYLVSFILWILTEIIFIILTAVEYFYGAKVIVEDDCFDIRMVLRRRKIWFNDIDDVNFSHYQKVIGHRRRRGMLSEMILPSRRKTVYRSRLDITLTSGKIISLNDAAPGYAKKQKLARVDFSVNADEDIELYKAYQCYRSLRYQYLNNQNMSY